MKEITAEELRALLKEGVVNFTFEKKNGEMRESRGTTSLNEIPLDNQPSGEDNRKKNENQLNFFDVEKGAWRSLRKDTTILLN